MADHVFKLCLEWEKLRVPGGIYTVSKYLLTTIIQSITKDQFLINFMDTSFIKIYKYTPFICFYRDSTLDSLQKRLWLPS